MQVNANFARLLILPRSGACTRRVKGLLSHVNFFNYQKNLTWFTDVMSIVWWKQDVIRFWCLIKNILSWPWFILDNHRLSSCIWLSLSVRWDDVLLAHFSARCDSSCILEFLVARTCSNISILGTIYSKSDPPCIYQQSNTRRILPQRQSVPVGPGWAPFGTLHCLRCLVGKEDLKQLKVKDFYPVDRTRPTGRCCVLRRCLQSAPKHGVAWYVYAATVCNCAEPHHWFRDSDVLAKPPCFLPQVCKNC